MTKIDSSMYLSNQPKGRTPSPDLGKDEFLKILMTQLANQDPLSPMDDKDFVAQMATFSQLEQMMQMSSSIDKLVQNQMISPVVQYSHMIGQEVTYEKIDKDTGAKSIVKSTVIGVSQQDGWAILELDNEDKVFADGILTVGEQNEVKDNEKPEIEGEVDVEDGESSDD